MISGFEDTRNSGGGSGEVAATMTTTACVRGDSGQGLDTKLARGEAHGVGSSALGDGYEGSD